MKECNGCPFFTSYGTITVWDEEELVPECILGFINYVFGCRAISEDCKLEAVTYSLSDKDESISFVPKEK